MTNKTKVYTYSRVSTSIQVDGYSLDAQKERIKKYCEAYDYEIVGEYEDAGKSGKSIEGRYEFKKMIDDIISQKDDVKFVVVFKLSRFGRNASDILYSLQQMQNYGCNLIAVDESLDSSKDTGKLLITILSAVSELERENILVQTMEGRRQKAREGKWNGGHPPYGYKLSNGELVIVEDEAEAIRVIFDRYVNSDMGANGIAKYLQQQGINKIIRKIGKNPYFSADNIRKIIANDVYNGKIRYEYRTKEMIKGKPGQYRQVVQDDYLLFDGKHEAIIDDITWEKAQEKRKKQTKKYEHVNRRKEQKIHLLSGIIKCPVCGSGMYGNKSIKKKADGTKYKDYYYYQCKHTNRTRGKRCEFRRQINEELIDKAVSEVISKLVSNPNFAELMKNKINLRTNTTEIDTELANYRKVYSQHIGTKRSLENQIDALDPEDKHYDRKLKDFNDRLDKIYDKIYDVEQLINECKDRKTVIENEKLTGENIYKALIYFDKLIEIMDEADKRELVSTLIEEINIHMDAKPNGQWLKSIIFKLPLIPEDMEISLDNGSHVEIITLLQKTKL